MNKFFQLSEKDRIDIINQTVIHKKIPAEAIEKDIWVTAVLHALFSLSYAKYLSFKGGTSLSKCYNLIERFSEDIDIAINREKFGFTGTLTKTQISDKLRRDTCKFVRDELQFDVNAVVPQRTFIEKICLLHEEFYKPNKQVRIKRMSRHLYDLERIMNTDIAEEALNNKNLYNSVVKHRRNFIRLKGFDYDTLAPKTINIVPPDHIIGLWKNDYETMQRTMIYGESLPFDKLIEKIKELNEWINQLEIILD